MPRLTRRTLLAAGGVLFGTGVAGCAETPSGETSSPTATTTPTAGDFSWPENARTFGTVSIGNRDGVADPAANRPHTLRLWNDVEAERPIRVRLTEGETSRYDETQTFPRNQILDIELLEPGAYQLGIYVADGLAGRVAIPRSQFDCNTSSTEVRIPPQGSIQRRTITTEMACYPRVTQTRFFIDGRVCGADDEAQVTLDANTVSVRGQLEVPSPCHGAALADARVENEGDVLRIDIESTPPLPYETCVKCIGIVEYRATVITERSGVSTVVVSHDGTEITRADR